MGREISPFASLVYNILRKVSYLLTSVPIITEFEHLTMVNVIAPYIAPKYISLTLTHNSHMHAILVCLVSLYIYLNCCSVFDLILFADSHYHLARDLLV